MKIRHSNYTNKYYFSLRIKYKGPSNINIMLKELEDGQQHLPQINYFYNDYNEPYKIRSTHGFHEYVRNDFILNNCTMNKFCDLLFKNNNLRQNKIIIIKGN